MKNGKQASLVFFYKQVLIMEHRSVVGFCSHIKLCTTVKEEKLEILKRNFRRDMIKVI